MQPSFDIASYLGIPIWLVVVIAIWSVIWMGLAMWKSARKNNLVWFIVFLLVHTLGILEILYIFVFSKSTSPQIKAVTRKKRR